jgi:hypothetical protein
VQREATSPFAGASAMMGAASGPQKLTPEERAQRRQRRQQAPA